MIKFTTLYNMLCLMTKNFHTYVIKSFGKGGKLLPSRMQTSILHSKNYLEARPILFHLINLWNNLILSTPNTFGMPLRSFCVTSNLDILVINTSTMLKNIYVVPKFSNTNSKVLDQCRTCIKAKISKIHLSMGLLMLPHNHIKVSRLISTSLVWHLMISTGRLNMN